MNLKNAIITINPARLNFPLATLHVRLLHSITAALVGIPDDVSSIVIRVFNAATTFVDVPVSRYGGDTNNGTCYIIGTCFPAVGSFKYEVHAYDARGNMTALGVGLIEVEDFTTSGEPITPGTSVPLTQIRDANGNYHSIAAVPDGMGGYTSIIDPEGGTNE